VSRLWRGGGLGLLWTQSHYLQRCTDPNRWHLRCEQPNGPRWFGGDAGRVNGGVDNATPLQKDGDR
jgi:hypothetical protein